MWTQIIAQKTFFNSSEKLTTGLHHLSSKEENSNFNDSYAAFFRIRNHFYTYYFHQELCFQLKSKYFFNVLPISVKQETTFKIN